MVQRFNAVLLRDSLLAADCTDWVIVPTLSVLGLIFKLPREYTYLMFRPTMGTEYQG